MPERIELPLDPQTADGLQRLGRDLVRSRAAREAFLRNRQEAMTKYNLHDVDLSKLDRQVIEMLADPAFSDAVEHRDINGIRSLVQERIGSRRLAVAGTFDFDFDVEVEVEIIVIAIAVFDFAVVRTRLPNEAELQRRRAIVAQAFEALGKQIER